MAAILESHTVRRLLPVGGVFLLAFACQAGEWRVALQATQQLPLISKTDFVYLGAFRVPSLPDRGTYEYGGTALAFNPTRQSLLLVGHDWYQLVGEVSVPKPAVAADVASLPVAVSLSGPHDVLGGRLDSINPDNPNAKKIGGLYPMADGSLVVSAYDFYDASGTQSDSHFRVSARGAVSGPYRVGDGPAGFVSGWMMPIPQVWQAAFGSPAMTGNCCLNIINRTSLGPSVTLFDPSNLPAQGGARMVLGYPIEHPTLGSWEEPGELYNGATTIRGAAFPAGSRSVLFLGTYGSTFCYGDGTDDPALNRKTGPDGATLCYDPTNKYKGAHGYPYAARIWAYDANDLVAVKNGALNPWAVRPYDTWSLDLPFQTEARAITGVAYDAATARLFVGSGRADGDQPLIHVFSLAPGTGVPLASAACEYGLFRGADAVPDGSMLMWPAQRTQVALTVMSKPESCTWTASSSVDWVSVSAPSGTGPATIVLAGPANQSTERRNAGVFVAEHYLIVSQAGLTQSPTPVIVRPPARPVGRWPE